MLGILNIFPFTMFSSYDVVSICNGFIRIEPHCELRNIWYPFLVEPQSDFDLSQRLRETLKQGTARPVQGLPTHRNWERINILF
jgi:hypothetical protein